MDLKKDDPKMLTIVNIGRDSSMRARILILILLISIPWLLHPQESSPTKTLPIPADLAAQVQQSIDLGHTLYLIDMASAIGTDMLQKKLGTSDANGIGGYLTVQDADSAGKALSSFLVLFFTNEVTPRIAYRIHVSLKQDKTAQIEEVQPPQPADSRVLKLIRARQTAIKAVPFQQPINPVVLPAEVIGQKGILVELLAATNKPGILVLGKHYRVIIADDGQEIKSITPLSKGILELSTVDERGARAAGLWATHLVTDYPLETHVFASLLNKVPLAVGTSRGVWLVNQGTIVLISKDVPGDKK
jgi:hypothetical protein